MNKVKLNVVKQVKVDGRNNNTGRPVNKKSSRQIRLAKQALYSKLNKQFVSGKKFKINNDGQSYVYNVGAVDKLRKNTYGGLYMYRMYSLYVFIVRIHCMSPLYVFIVCIHCMSVFTVCIYCVHSVYVFIVLMCRVKILMPSESLKMIKMRLTARITFLIE